MAANSCATLARSPVVNTDRGFTGSAIHRQICRWVTNVK
jgi:hypothetical protein